MQFAVLGALAASNMGRKIFDGASTGLVYYSAGSAGKTPDEHLTNAYILLDDSSYYKAASVITLDAFDLSRYSKVRIRVALYDDTASERTLAFRTYTAAPHVGSSAPAVIDEVTYTVTRNAFTVELDISAITGEKYVGIRAKNSDSDDPLLCRITDWRLLK